MFRGAYESAAAVQALNRWNYTVPPYSGESGVNAGLRLEINQDWIQKDKDIKTCEGAFVGVTFARCFDSEYTKMPPHNSRVYFLAITTSMGAFLFGYDLAFIGTTIELEPFQK